MTSRARTASILVGLPLLVGLMALPLGLNPLARAQQAGEYPIVEIMEEVNRNYRLLQRAARRPAFNEQSLEQVAQMQIHAVKAMHETFPMAERVSGAERTQMLIGFKRLQAKLVNALFELEIALLEERHEDAVALIQELGEIREEGHAQYVDE